MTKLCVTQVIYFEDQKIDQFYWFMEDTKSWKTQRGFMGTIADDYNRSIAEHLVNEGLPKIITYISPINMVAEDNHLYFAYKSPLGMIQSYEKNNQV